jgi:tetratricopeptide (TPR) repeat protein
MQQKQYKKVIENLTQAIKRNPKAPSYYLERRADAHFQLGEYQAAIDDYSLAIDVDTEKPWLFAGRALAYDKVDSLNKAGKDLDAIEALKKKPAKQKIPDFYEDITNKPSASLDFLAKPIRDRRNQILVAASKLKRG